MGYCSLLGTPAEEGGGGKVKLLEAGAYDGLDCSLMAHPGNSGYAAWGRTLASWRANVSWTGSTFPNRLKLGFDDIVCRTDFESA